MSQRLILPTILFFMAIPAVFGLAGPAEKGPWDKYGGWREIRCQKTGRFHTQKIGDRWWLCTPDGNVFWSVGVYNINALQNTTPDNQGSSYYQRAIHKYGNADTSWGPQQNRRLLSWGFNTIGEFSEMWVQPYAQHPQWPGGGQPVRLPAINLVQPSLYSMRNLGNFAHGPVKDILYGLDANYKGWRGSGLPDFLDENYSLWLRGQLSRMNQIESRWIIGMTVDETDNLWGFGAGPDFATTPPGHNSDNPAWLVLATSPVQSFDPSPVNMSPPQVYSDMLIYSKAGRGLDPPSLRDYLAAKYKTIAALNQAWNSQYTTFDSTGNTVKGEPIGKADGSARVFTHSLAHAPVSAYSTLVEVNHEPVAGDCPGWIAACHAGPGRGSIRSGAGRPGVEGMINYATGELTVQFASPPPAGSEVTVDYVSGGWGLGSGLMDEDGRHTRWMGSPSDSTQRDPSLCLKSTPVCHASANRRMAEDLDHWLVLFAGYYFKTAKEALQANGKTLYFSTTVGTWRAPSRREVLEAAGPYVDVLHMTWDGSQAQLDFVAKNFGDKPITTWEGFAANSDSCLFRYKGTLMATQEDRGKEYLERVRLLWNGRTSQGIHPFVGFRWWDYVDMWNEKTNWGLVSLSDNAYDGKEDREVAGKDPWGFPTGGEERDFGDFISAVKQANGIWHSGNAN